MSSVESQGQSATPIDEGGEFVEEPEYTLVIQDQQDLLYGTLFYGYVDVGTDVNGFSGAIEGKSITMTAWDSVTWGDLVVKGNKPMEIHFSNNAFRGGEVKKKVRPLWELQLKVVAIEKLRLALNYLY